jgi:hypothetical protein
MFIDEVVLTAVPTSSTLVSTYDAPTSTSESLRAAGRSTRPLWVRPATETPATSVRDVPKMSLVGHWVSET